MSYQIETIPPFDKAVKRLTRKYRHIWQGWPFPALPIRCGRYGWPVATFGQGSVVGIE